MIFWAAGLVATVLLTLCFAARQVKYGRVRAAVAGTGFFVAALYLDSIFFLIMGGMGNLFREPEGSFPVLLGILGFFVSKSILAAVLLAAQTVKGEPEEDGWHYPDRLALGVNLFFGGLALICPYPVGLAKAAGGPGSGFLSGEDGTGHGRFAGALWLTFLLGVLLLYNASYYFYRKKQCAERIKTAEEAGRDRADLYLKNVEAQYQRTRELRHDLKNHIDLLRLLLREKKYEEMEDYLRIFGESVDSLALPVRSGNLVVDALLADKAARAKREQIRVELSLCDLRGLPLRPDEICSLLGNLLDNAIEAAGRAAEGRFLAVEWVERKTDYFLRVRNAVPEECGSARASEKNGSGRSGKAGVAEDGAILGVPRKRGAAESTEPRSRKQDRRNQVGHGLGLRSVERTVHGCGGELAVESREGQFMVAVRLPKQ